MTIGIGIVLIIGIGCILWELRMIRDLLERS
ncbi:hypothetical protein LCGC14_2811780 [marine sediment metagenome]|uniref:Uncharacterized protein n=1 Tax=marine sediment metagenome TaxID=412755 RepID=A0A0F9BB01_9ZZZZ